MVPASTIVVMAAALTILIGLLIGVFWLLRRKVGIKMMPVAVGAVFFVIFALILEQNLHSLVLPPSAHGQTSLSSNHAVVYVIWYTCRRYL